jgi:hypothetical protein
MSDPNPSPTKSREVISRIVDDDDDGDSSAYIFVDDAMIAEIDRELRSTEETDAHFLGIEEDVGRLSEDVIESAAQKIIYDILVYALRMRTRSRLLFIENQMGVYDVMRSHLEECRDLRRIHMKQRSRSSSPSPPNKQQKQREDSV